MLHVLRQGDILRKFGRLLGHTVACISMLAFAAPAAKAQALQARYLLSTQQIVNAMQNRQLPTSGVRVRLAAPITAVVANPALEIQAIAPVNSHEVRLRMSCRDRSECLSFFAIATYSDTADVEALQKPQVQSAASVLPPTKPMNPEDATIRSGSPAVLDFEGERLHIRVEVICLESGKTGDRIHVTTRDHKQFYIAEIVTPNALKGTLTK